MKIAVTIATVTGLICVFVACMVGLAISIISGSDSTWLFFGTAMIALWTAVKKVIVNVQPA